VVEEKESFLQSARSLFNWSTGSSWNTRGGTTGTSNRNSGTRYNSGSSSSAGRYSSGGSVASSPGSSSSSSSSRAAACTYEPVGVKFPTKGGMQYILL